MRPSASSPPLPSRRRRLVFAPALVALAIPLSLILTAPACEPRVEEPLPPVHADGFAPGGKQPKEANMAGSTPKRCIRKTPDKPARKLSPGPDPKCPPDDLPEPPKLRTAKLTFPEAGGVEVTVEVADTEKTRERGLMFRKSMPDDRGMIFLFNTRENHTFWMHNTCISLDMLFIDDDGTIVGIEENVPTMDDSTFEVGCLSKYVLEVNAGWTRKNGVKAGQKIDLRGL